MRQAIAPATFSRGEPHAPFRKLIWDERTLERWLSDPERLVPGQKMGLRVAQPEDRADLIAHLKRESDR
jgi:cytochrome c